MPLHLAAFDLDPRIIFAVIFVVFGGLKWLWENVLGKNQNQETKSREEIATELEDVYEQYRAKIVERQTTIQEPEPELIPIPQPQQITIQSPPPTPKPKIPIPKPKAKPQQLTEAEKEALDRLKNSTTDLQLSRKKKSTSEGLKVRQLLKSPGTVRTAVVLQEVLGKPKGLH